MPHMVSLLPEAGAQTERQRGGRKTGRSDPPALWVAFVGVLPRRFAPPITTVPAEGPSAEWFDRSLPRHPPCRADLALSSRDGRPDQCLSARPPLGIWVEINASVDLIPCGNACAKRSSRPC